MCGIGGVWSPRRVNLEFVNRLIGESERRGLDALGAAIVPKDGGRPSAFRAPGRPSEAIKDPAWNAFYATMRPGDLLMFNSRAQPLTEPESVGTETVQPVTSPSWCLVHNGVVANEEELLQDEGLRSLRRSSIDSELIALMLEAFSVRDTMSRLAGGFAVAATRWSGPSGPMNLHLVKDFKTLSWAWHDELGIFAFASEPEFLEAMFCQPSHLFGPLHIEHLPAFTHTEIAFYENRPRVRIQEPIRTKPIHNLPPQGGKAVVCASGGIDSTTAAFIAKHIHKKEVALVHFAHGQKSGDMERLAVSRVADELGAPLSIVPMSWLGVIGKSVLTDENLPVPHAEQENIKSTICILNKPGTFVWTRHGPNKSPNKVKEGDVLLGYDENSGAIAETVVKEAFVNKAVEYLEIELDVERRSVNRIYCTPEHPFFVDGEWRQAADLRVNDMLFHLTDAEKQDAFREKIQEANRRRVAAMHRSLSPAAIAKRSAKISRSMKKNNPMKRLEQRERMRRENPMRNPKTVRKVLSSRGRHPNKMETRCAEAFRRIADIRFVGDGSLLIGGKNPDFIVEGQKKLIEVYDPTAGFYMRGVGYENERQEHFAEHGYETLCLAVDSASRKVPSEVIQRVSEFVHNGVRVKLIKKHKRRVKVYNYHCEPFNNYFVNGVLVHNCWTPARNLVMMSALAAIAEVEGADSIYAGWSLEEEGSYPDNSIDFFRSFNDVLDYGTLTRPKIRLSLSRLMKKETVLLGQHLGVPYELTWSCDDGNPEGHCGKCGACFLHHYSFVQAGLEDPTTYAGPLEFPFTPPWDRSDFVATPVPIEKIMEKIE